MPWLCNKEPEGIFDGKNHGFLMFPVDFPLLIPMNPNQLWIIPENSPQCGPPQ